MYMYIYELSRVLMYLIIYSVVCFEKALKEKVEREFEGTKVEILFTNPTSTTTFTFKCNIKDFLGLR